MVHLTIKTEKRDRDDKEKDLHGEEEHLIKNRN